MMEKTNPPATMEAMPRRRSRDGSRTAMWAMVSGCLLMMLTAIVDESELAYSAPVLLDVSGRHALVMMRPQHATADIHQLQDHRRQDQLHGQLHLAARSDDDVRPRHERIVHHRQ